MIYVITDGIERLCEITYNLEMEHQKNIILFVDVVLHRINHFVMVCIGQLILKMIKTTVIRRTNTQSYTFHTILHFDMKVMIKIILK